MRFGLAKAFAASRSAPEMKNGRPSERTVARRYDEKRLQLHVVALGVRGDADLVDRTDVTRGEVERHETPELGNPDASRLNVHVLPALGLDVGVRDVLCSRFPLAGDVALCYGRNPTITPTFRNKQLKNTP